jgi:hypothetical protein
MVVNEWIEQGRQEALAEVATVLQVMLLHYLERRFGAEMPDSLRRQIETQSDLDVLGRWFDQALKATSLEQFVADLPQSNGTAS